MTDMERAGEMPTGAMEEAIPASEMHALAKPEPENPGDAFRATAKILIPELIGVIQQKSVAQAESLPAAEPPVGKMPGEDAMTRTEHSGKMPGEST